MVGSLVDRGSEQTLRKELADRGQDNEDLFGAERADVLENERCVCREQLRRLHDRFLWKYSIDAIALVDCERTVHRALGRDRCEDEILHRFIEGIR